MDLSGLREKINGILENLKGIPKKAGGFPRKNNKTRQITGGFLGEIKGLVSVLTARINRAVNRFGPDKKKPLLIGFGGLAALFLILAIAAGILNSKKRRGISPDAAAGGLTISAEELFIPAEPDFVPEFIFEREQRRFWSLEDIRPYWKTPDLSDRWREEIKSAVDKLMEDVP
jgi:hypothetical protein